MNTYFRWFLLCFLFSCEKGHIQQHHGEPPSIRSAYPGRSVIYREGDTIKIKAKISDNIELHEISVTLKDVSKNRSLLNLNEHIHVQNYHLDTFLILPVKNPGARYQFKIYANNHAEKSILHEEVIEVL